MNSLLKLEEEFMRIEEDDDWRHMFHSLKHVTYPCSAAKHSSNLKLNRYQDILPYDHSRVKLANADNTDYINANFVECNRANRKYILAQGPLKTTCEHFWEMIWEQNTRGIIMLNRLVENERAKCFMYYPNSDEEDAEMRLDFGKFRLNYVSERLFQDFAIRIIECENAEQKETREVYHIHFTKWPDFGEPDQPNSFLRLLEETENLGLFDTSRCGPNVIHCSAGVGRSGTFVLVDSMIQLYKIYGDNVPMSVMELLEELRTYRMALVQTPGQLKFAYTAIISALKKIHQPELSSTLPVTTANFSKVPDEDEEDSGEESSSDEEFSDEEVSSASTKPKRPDTAKHVKKIKLNDKKHTKRLRLKQLEHKGRGTRNSHNEQEQRQEINIPETAKPERRGGPAEPSDEPIVIKTDESSDSEEVEDDDDDEYETVFARTSRDIQTVKVNEPRKRLAETLDSKSGGSSSVEPVVVATGRAQSEKDKRIADMVSAMKEKQRKHEETNAMRKQYDVKPMLIGGGIFLSGIIIHQLMKMFFK